MRAPGTMDALEALGIASELALLVAVGANIALALRLWRGVRHVPAPVVTARVYGLATTWSPLWAAFTLGMVFFVAGFLSHSAFGLLATGTFGEGVHEIAEAVLGAAGFTCFGFGLAAIDRRLRQERSPLLASAGRTGVRP